MKKARIQGWITFYLAGLSLSLTAAPMRVALTDFTVLAARGADAKTVGSLEPDHLAAQGAFALGQVLLEEGGFCLLYTSDAADE